MLVECTNCGTKMDPNDETTQTAPPTEGSRDLFSIVCPNPDCTNIADFSEYKTLTGKQAEEPDPAK